MPDLQQEIVLRRAQGRARLCADTVRVKAMQWHRFEDIVTPPTEPILRADHIKGYVVQIEDAASTQDQNNG